MTLSGGRAYVTERQGGIQMFDISDPEAVLRTAVLNTPGLADDIFLSDGLAYVADMTHFTIIPVPVEIKPVIIDENTLSVTLPTPEIEGNYTLKVINETKIHGITGAITFLHEVADVFETKAIIAAGRNGDTDSVLPAFRLNADQAYTSLGFQGYSDDRIYYLAPDSELDGKTDGDATIDNLNYAITEWATPASALLVYFVGHGEDGAFNVNAAETLRADVLDQWLDDAQSSISGPVIFIYNACWSGTFIQPLAEPNRYVVTSGSEGASWFLNGGYCSFSYQFWTALNSNDRLLDTINISETTMDYLGLQPPQLDADGNGIPGEAGDRTAMRDIEIGRGRYVDIMTASIGSAYTIPETLDSVTEATIIAEDLSQPTEDILRVWATITPPDSETAVEADLAGPDANGGYEYVYNGFTVQGTYNIMLFSQLKDVHDAICLPKQMTLTKFDGASTSQADEYETDDDSGFAKPVTVNDPDSQFHNFHREGDVDWVTFSAVAGNYYTIQASDLSSICNVALSLYDANGSLLGESDRRGMGGNETLEWECISNGDYYVKIENATEPKNFGENVNYYLKVYMPSAEFWG